MVTLRVHNILLKMLCNIAFEYLDGDFYEYRNIYERVDLDYFNIRHWREVYSLLESECKKYNGFVHLKIIPLRDDIVL